jgi:hypothetical protein
MEVGEVLTSVRDDYCEEFYKYYLHDFVRNVHKSQNKKQEAAETEYNVSIIINIPYSRKIWRFGGLYYNCQIKIRQNFLLAYIRMAIPYRTAKFKSANILAIAILGSTAKFNSRQYFQLYGMKYNSYNVSAYCQHFNCLVSMRVSLY